MSDVFDEIRTHNADAYTRHPLLDLPDEELRRYMPEGMTLDAFKIFLCRRKDEMTCPLCGHPQNHLSDCKGCKNDAFTGWDFIEAYGEDAAQHLRDQLKAFLEQSHPDLADYVSHQAYPCMVCADCWKEAIQTSNSYLFCPLRLFSNRILDGSIVQGLLYLGNAELAMQTLRAGVNAWLTNHTAWRASFYELMLSKPSSDTLARHSPVGPDESR